MRLGAGKEHLFLALIGLIHRLKDAEGDVYTRGDVLEGAHIFREAGASVASA